jgi:hypothetical protein
MNHNFSFPRVFVLYLDAHCELNFPTTSVFIQTSFPTVSHICCCRGVLHNGLQFEARRFYTFVCMRGGGCTTGEQ